MDVLTAQGSAATLPVAATATLSVVVPAFNEQEVLPEFHRRLAAVLDGLAIAAEVVYVNDGSSDSTWALLNTLRESDARVALVDLSLPKHDGFAVLTRLRERYPDASIPTLAVSPLVSHCSPAAAFV